MERNSPSLAGLGVQHIRRENLRKALEAIRKYGPLSRADLARLLNLSPPTSSSLVDHLEAASLVRETTVDTSRRGRPPVVLEARRDAGAVLGLEITPGRLRASRAALDGHVLATLEESRDRYHGVSETIDACHALLSRLEHPAEAIGGEALALTVAVPGIVDTQRGEIVLARHLLGWRQVPLGRLIGEAYAFPVTVENDIRCAAVGEYAYGVAVGRGTFVFVGLCEGIGSAIIVDGRLLRGEHFLAGEIGYLATDLNNMLESSAERNYLEALASPVALQEQATEALRRGRRSALEDTVTGPALTLPAILSAAQGGDSLAIELVASLARGLAFAISNVSAVCDPGLVVLGTDDAAGSEILLQQVRALVRAQLPFQPEILASSLGPRGALAGALFLAARRAEEILLDRSR